MRVLQIAYYYPPMGGAGVQRALKFSKYLPQFGVEPVVLAAHNRGYVTDTSLVQEIPPGVAVHRVEHQPLLQRLLAKREPLHAPATVAPSAPPSLPLPLRPWLRDALLGSYAALQYPDDKWLWARRAHQEARRILRTQRIDLIMSSSPPVSAHKLGARLSCEFGLPWVPDFRDLWTENPGYAAPGWRRLLDRRAETSWLRQASGIVTVTPSWQRMLARRVGSVCPVECIQNGYDESDFAGVRAAARDAETFRLVHTGTFYGPRGPDALLDGVAGYLASAAPGVRPLRVRLIGNMGSRFEARLTAFNLRHPDVVECVPYLPHRQALAEMMAADALLLVVGGTPGEATAGWLPGKIFEYLRAAKPVLMLGAEDGDAADLIRRHSSGWVVDPSNVPRIAQALKAMVEMAPAGCVDSGTEPVECFERRELARQLAAFLIRCTGGDHGRA